MRCSSSLTTVDSDCQQLTAALASTSQLVHNLIMQCSRHNYTYEVRQQVVLPHNGHTISEDFQDLSYTDQLCQLLLQVSTQLSSGALLFHQLLCCH